MYEIRWNSTHLPHLAFGYLFWPCPTLSCSGRSFPYALTLILLSKCCQDFPGQLAEKPAS